MSYETQKIAELETLISAATLELNYLKAWLYLANLEKTALTPVCEVFQSHYGSEIKTFPYQEITHTSSLRRDYVKVIRNGLSRYKDVSELTEKPIWANEAIKAAKAVNAYHDAQRALK